MTRVLVVDDELLVRVGVTSCIDWEANGFTIVGQAANGREALRIVEREGAEIVLTDILMPDMDGLELIEQLRIHHPGVRVVVLSCHDELEYVKTAMKRGAVDYILKLSLHPEDLLRVVQEARADLAPGRAALTDVPGRAAPGRAALTDVPGRAAPAGGALAIPPSDEEPVLAALRRGLSEEVDTASYARKLSAALTTRSMRSFGAAAFRLADDADPLRMVPSCLSLSESMSGNSCRVVGLRAGARTVALTMLLDTDADASRPRMDRLCADLRERMMALFNVESDWAVAGPVSDAGRIANALLDALDALNRATKKIRPEIQRVREYVRAHLSERLSVRQAAEMACMSPNHFSTTFRKETAESFVHFTNRLKIQKARRLMEEEGCLVYQAAEAVGINDIPYFSKLFKRITGANPSETRTGVEPCRP
jgi:DNA-binding NarL/FixJ family response regulator/AraC-like DNA-binding protein